jgi:hypothetical protein
VLAPGHRDPRRGGAEADELRVDARPRRERLAPDVERLEQVRLADTVCARDENEAGLEVELERAVRAVVAKGGVPDDQQPPPGAASRARISRRA